LAVTLRRSWSQALAACIIVYFRYIYKLRGGPYPGQSQ